MTQLAIYTICRRDIVGKAQHGKRYLGMRDKRFTWHKISSSKLRKLVVDEIHRREDLMMCVRAKSRANQDQRMR